MSFREANKLLLWLGSYSPRLFIYFTGRSMSMLGVMGWRPEYFVEIRKTHYKKCERYRRLRDKYGDKVDYPTSEYYGRETPDFKVCELCNTMVGAAIQRKYVVLGVITDRKKHEYPWGGL